MFRLIDHEGNANKAPDVIPFYSHLMAKNKSSPVQKDGENMDPKKPQNFHILQMEM